MADIPRGRRQTTTFKKLNTLAPIKKYSAAAIYVSMILSPVYGFDQF